MLKLVAGWLLLLSLIVVVIKLQWGEQKPSSPLEVKESATEDNIPAGDRLFLHEGLPICREIFAKFLAAATPAERAQYVMNPGGMAVRMVNFESMNPLSFIDYTNLTLKSSTVLHFINGRGIETQWNFKDNRIIDVVFMESNGQWRLDWEHYIFYSNQPLVSFLAESGDARAEFRLLARERLADERKNKDSLSIIFYAPLFGYPGKTGFSSPEFIVPRKSKNGRLLDAAFELEKSGKRAFDLKLRKSDPDGLIHVRVRIHRSGEGADRKFELENVVACHWYSSDDPGVEISAPVNK